MTPVEIALSLPGYALRPYSSADADRLTLLANEHEVARWLRDRFPHPYTSKDAGAWIERCAGESPPLAFAIVSTLADRPAAQARTAGLPFHAFAAGEQGAIAAGGGAAAATSTVGATPATAVLVGGIGLDRQGDVYRHSAELGYWLGRPYWGRGVATAAVQAICRYGFETLGLARIYACVFAPNIGSARVLEKAGFVFEGRRRHGVLKDGRLLDELMYGLLLPRRHEGTVT